MGRLGRSKVVLIVNKGVEIPSNLSGLFFLEYVNDIEETFPDLRVILNARDAFVSAKLYDARHQRVLKKGYRVKYVSVHQPGHDAKYVPVYLSPAGDEVFEDEATFEEIAIFAVPDTAPSRSDREFAIDKISRIFKDKSDAKVDCSQLEHAIEAMALEDDLTLKVGQQLAERLSSENPNDEFAVRLLVKSGLKDAIAPLTKLLVYEASYDHRCCEDSVHRLALETLRKFVADKPEFRYEAARAALALFARWREGYYRDLVKTWAVELLDGLANSTSTERDWAREQLKELEVA